jgi:hypothetical protein
MRHYGPALHKASVSFSARGVPMMLSQSPANGYLPNHRQSAQYSAGINQQSSEKVFAHFR